MHAAAADIRCLTPSKITSSALPARRLTLSMLDDYALHAAEARRCHGARFAMPDMMNALGKGAAHALAQMSRWLRRASMQRLRRHGVSVRARLKMKMPASRGPASTR